MLPAGDKSLFASTVPEVMTVFSTHITDASVVDNDVESVLENSSQSFWCNDLSDFEGLKESSEIWKSCKNVNVSVWFFYSMLPI
jgi:hypothetical protein